MLDWITGFMSRSGYLGIAALMLAENVFPPIPSELVMPLAGFTAAQGHLNVGVAIAAGSAGSLLGALFWYGVGRWIGPERLKAWAARRGRWLTLTPGEVDDACRWFDAHGGKTVLFGRLVPAIRTLVSVPAGIARMPLPRFLLYSALGTAIWTTMLTAAGYQLGERYGLLASWLDPVTWAVVGVLIAWYGYRVMTFGRRARG